MDSFETFTTALAQSHEAELSARQLAVEAARQLQASEKLASSAVAMRRDAVDQFAANLVNEDPLYSATLQITWLECASAGPEERIQNHQLEQLQLADVAANKLLQLEKNTKTRTTGLPFVSVVYQQLEYISNTRSLSNPHESDLQRTKVAGLTALIGVLAPQPLTVDYVFERTAGKVNGAMVPLGVGVCYSDAVRIHSQTGGWDYDVWESDPSVQNNQSGTVTVIGQKQRIPEIAIISLEQGSENIYMAFPRGSELHIGSAALADFAHGLDLYTKPHDKAAFQLVHHMVRKLYNAV